MDYFDDLSLVWGDEYPHCEAAIDRRYDDICSIQLSLGGPLLFGVDHRPPTRTESPLFFWHHPSLNYQYQGVWHHLWVSFRGPRALRLMERGFMPLGDAGCFIPDKTKWAAQTMRELIFLSRTPDKNRAKATLLLEEILLWAEEEVEGGKFNQLESIQKVTEITEKVRSRPDRRFNFPRAAAKAGLSFSHFRALFRQLTGDSPLGYVLRQLMEQAAADLERTHLTIGQVGLRAGYPDQAQFSKAFKKCMGLSPENFRKGVPALGMASKTRAKLQPD
jgi:AraC-like DNA-binding protein